jgi:hypothetical protein
VVMYRVKLLMVSGLMVLMVGATASTVSALPTAGPFWQVNNTKLSVGATKAVEGKIVSGTAAVISGKVAGKMIEIVCKTFQPTVSIFNSTQHGEGLGKAVFEECVVLESGTAIKECEVNAEAKPKNSITTTEVRSSLWYGVTNVGKTKTALDRGLFVPKTGKIFFSIELAGVGCGALEGVYKLEGSVAATGSPENTEAETLKVTFPVEQQKHVWQPKNSPEETQASLLFNATEAQFCAEGELKLTTKEKFGVIE